MRRKRHHMLFKCLSALFVLSFFVGAAYAMASGVIEINSTVRIGLLDTVISEPENILCECEVSEHDDCVCDEPLDFCCECCDPCECAGYYFELDCEDIDCEHLECGVVFWQDCECEEPTDDEPCGESEPCDEKPTYYGEPPLNNEPSDDDEPVASVPIDDYFSENYNE
jgi:hypothetical protein